MELIDTTQLALHRALAATGARQATLANNLANANTPGYRRQDVDFQGALASAVASGRSSVERFHARAAADPTAPLRFDGSNVDVDKENAAMAENGLLSEALTSVSKARVNILRSAMGVNR